MYTERLIELARRKERLIARCDQQRTMVAGALHAWQKPLALLDRTASVINEVRSHPLFVGVGVAVLVVLARRRLLRWAGHGLIVWRAWRTAGTWLQRFVR